MKLTKQETKLHDEAMALVNLERKLTDEEIEFVFENFHPGATNNLGPNGIFFTPLGLAQDLATFNYPTGDRGGLRYVDACAGIGALSWAITCCDGVEKKIEEIVAIELNPEFVAIGKRLLPHVTWIRGSIFDLDLVKGLGGFHIGLSNPPYGRTPYSVEERSWLKVRTPAHLAVAEVLAYMCERGAGMIIPDVDHNQEDKGRDRYLSGHYTKFVRELPGLRITPEPLCTACYDFKEADPNVAVVSLNQPDPMRKETTYFQKWP